MPETHSQRYLSSNLEQPPSTGGYVENCLQAYLQRRR